VRVVSAHFRSLFRHRVIQITYGSAQGRVKCGFNRFVRCGSAHACKTRFGMDFFCHHIFMSLLGCKKKLISIGLSDTAEFLRHLPAARAGRVGAAPGKSL